MPAIRPAAVYVARQDMDYLESSIRSLLPFMETILIGIRAGEEIDHGSLQAVVTGSADVPVCTPPKVGECLDVCEEANETPTLPAVRCIEGDWKNESECRAALLNELSKGGITHAFLMEPEDVLIARDLRCILDFVKAHPDANRFLVHCKDYWKSPSYRIEPRDPEPRVLASRIAKRTGSSSFDKTKELQDIVLPETVGVLHRFTFASPSKVVKSRVAATNVASDIRRRWETEVWQNWNGQKNQRNLHPVAPERFRVAQRVNLAGLPESLCGHPYLQFEIAGETRRAAPLFSVFFEGGPHPTEVEVLLDNLARAAPDRFEWIACVPDSSPETADFLKQKPGAKVVTFRPEGQSLTSVWNDAVEMAEGEVLVFLQDRLSFEGDWLEGIQAAVERCEGQRASSLTGGASRISQSPNSAISIFVPRVLPLAALEDGVAPTAGPQSSITPRQLLFEQRRGRFYEELTPIEQGVVLEELPCWACLRRTWNRLLASQASNPPTAWHVEDTLVFSATSSSARIPELRVENNEVGSDIVEDSNASLPLATCHSRLAASIIIPIFNNLSLTRQCLESIFENTTPGPYEVIVVDNGSTDGSRQYLEALQPRIRYIRNSTNLFFARGCNRGAWAARGRNLVFLNNDTVVKPGWLEAMLQVLADCPEVGIVGNKQLFPSSNPIYSGLVWHAGMAFTEQRDSWHVFFGFDPGHPAVNVQRECPCVTGCCLLIRKSLFQKLQGFDPWFQNGYEDTDLCLRAGEIGARIVYTPKSEIVHHVSASESRFDRHIANFLRFRERWAERIIPSELQCYRDAGLIGLGSEPHSALIPRVGFISAFNQQSAFADYAHHLLTEFPSESHVVLSDYAVHSRLSRPDPKQVIRCWDPSGSWLQPLARWIHTLDLKVLHISLDITILQRGFFNVLKGARENGKKLVFTLHHTSPPSALLREFCNLADAVIVHSLASRMELILNGCETSKIYVVTPGVTHPGNSRPQEQSSSRLPNPALRQKLGLRAFSKIIATPGFVSRRKGILEVINSLASIRDVADVQYLVLGTADPEDPQSAQYLGECKALVRQHRLERHVTFIERFLPAPELTEFLSCADAVALPYQSGRQAWSSAAALALSLGLPVVVNGDPMFLELGDAVLRATGGLSLVQAIVSVLTNPFLADQLRQRARAYAAAHTWKDCASELWTVYREVLTRSEQRGLSPFIQYQVWNSRSLRASDAERLLPQLENRLSGKVIEFASRCLELTEAIRPEASITSQTELVVLAKLLQTKTSFLTLDEFRTSALSNQVFDTILLHLSDSAEPSFRLVRDFLPHLSSQQKVLLVLDTADPRSIQAARQIESVTTLAASRVDLGGSVQLIELTRTETGPGASVRSVPPKSREHAGGSSAHAASLGTAPQSQQLTVTTNEDRQAHVCWEGPQLVNHSLALVNRELEFGLLASGRVHLSIAPVGPDSFANQLGARDRRLKQHYGRMSDAPLDVHVRHQWPPNWTPPAEGHFVVIQPWEYGSLPVEWVEEVNAQADEVWAPSTFVRDLYVQSGVDSDRVHVVPNGVDTALFNPDARRLAIPSRKTFRFLFVGGTIARKGIDLLLRAYAKSFRADDNVSLIVKDMGAGSIYQGQGLGDHIRQLQQDPQAPEIVYLDEDLSTPDMAGLYTACHCLVHPYRGEGFALPVLEAMSCGLPVITTAGGATDDFVDDFVGYRLSAKKQVFGNREISGMKTVGDLWMLEPDSHELAGMLVHVFRNREEAQAKGRLGRERAETAWTWQHASLRALERITQLRRMPVFRFQQKAECVVLLNVPAGSSPEALRMTLNSLIQNSYAALSIYVCSNQRTEVLDTLTPDFPQARFLYGSGMQSFLEQMQREVRAPYLALLSMPMRFSKQWLSQVMSVARQVGGELIVAPSVDLEGAGHFVRYEGDSDDHSFQKFSRALWRGQRAKFQPLASVPAGCAVLSWSCLERAVGEFGSGQEWLANLCESGVPAYWAQDTFVGKIEAPDHLSRSIAEPTIQS